MPLPPRPAALLLAALLLPAWVAAPLAQGVAGGRKSDPYVPPADVKQAESPETAIPAEDLRLDAEDPPALVGRVARQEGRAALRLPGGEEWQDARLNTAITEGTALWTEPEARLAIELAETRLFLEGGSALQIEELDEDGLRATLAQGSLLLRAQGLGAQGGLLEVATPEASLTTTQDGRYLIEAPSPETGKPGRIAVYEGAAEVTPRGGEPLRLTAGQALRLPPGAPPERVPAGATTPLMAWALAAEPRRPIPQAARGMTGIAELAIQGRWETSPDYGDVWYPPVAQDWQPYRDGAWEWREPWGWVWVDAAPWGFAPAHYGRWVRVGPRWAWAPRPVRYHGPPVRPVWAPALVVFFGGGAGGRPVGWVPLAPREAYYPWYRASPRYVQRVNIRQVTNVVQVRNVWVQHGGDRRWDDDRRRDPGWARFHDRRIEEFRHRNAALQVPERVMRASLPVRPEARPLRAEEARGAEPLGGPPVRPGGETRGLTERGAERLGLPREALRRAEAERGPAPPPQVRAALAEPRRAAERPDMAPREAVPPEAPRPDPDRREAGRPEPGREPPGPAPERRAPPLREGESRAAARAEREQALRQRLNEEPRRAAPPAGAPATPQPPRAAERPAGPGDAPRQQADQQRQMQREQARQQQDQARRQQAEQQRQMQREQMRQQQDQARRQQAEQQRQMQREQMRQQQDQARRQQAEQRRQERPPRP